MVTGIYVRVSTEEQAQEGFSIRAQEQKLKDYVRIKDWVVYKVYADEGISGKNITERPAINEMIEDVKKGHVKNILVFKIDRLTRNTADLISLVDLFNSYECSFNSLTESIDTHSATGRMFIKIIGIFAEFERENIGERSRLGFERKAREGYSMCTLTSSYGYEREKGQKIQHINDCEAQIVKEIFNMYVNKNMSYLEIAKALNARKVPTKENALWHARTIKNVLTNCNYVGRVRYATKDEKRYFEAEGVHEPIIARELFDEAQTLIAKIKTKSYTKRPKEEHYFTNILVCAKCGGKMVTHGRYDNKKFQAGAYRCANYFRKTCDVCHISHTKVEKAFCEYIQRINDFNDLDGLQLPEQESQKEKNIKLKAIYQNKLEKLEAKEKEVLNSYINGNVDFDSYISIKNSINEEKKRIEAELNKIDNFEEEEEANIKNEDIIRNIKENWNLLTNLEKRQFLLKFVEKIEIDIEKTNNKKKRQAKIITVEFYKQ